MHKLPPKKLTLIEYYAATQGYDIALFPKVFKEKFTKDFSNCDMVFPESMHFLNKILDRFEQFGIPTSPDIYSLKVFKIKKHLSEICRSAHVPCSLKKSTQRPYLSLLIHRNQSSHLTCYLPFLATFDGTNIYFDQQFRPEGFSFDHLETAFRYSLKLLQSMDAFGTIVMHFQRNNLGRLAFAGIGFTPKGTVLEELNDYGNLIRHALGFSPHSNNAATSYQHVPHPINIIEPLAARKFAIEQAMELLVNPYRLGISSRKEKKSQKACPPSRTHIQNQILIAVALHHILMDTDEPVWLGQALSSLQRGCHYM